MSKRRNIFGGFSLKRQILVAFSLVFVVFISQVGVSSNSVIQMRNDYEISINQNLIKDEANAILQLQESLAKNMFYWSSGFYNEYDVPLNQFNETYTNLQKRFDALENVMYLLQKNPRNELIDMSNGSNIYYNLVDSFDLLYYERMMAVYGFPSFTLISQIQTRAININFNFYEMMNSLSIYLFNKTAANENKYLERSLKVQSFDLIEFSTLLSFNKTLYDDFNAYTAQTTEFGKNITKLSDALFIKIRNDIVNVTSMSVEEFDIIDGMFHAMYEKVEDFEHFNDEKIAYYQRMEKSLGIALSLALNNLYTLNNEVVKLINWATRGQELTITRFQETIVRQIITLVIMAIIGIIILFIVYYRIIRDIIQPIESVAIWSEFISEGDLTKSKIIRQRQDEVGVLEKNFKRMNYNLRNIIKDVQETNELIAFTSEELSSNTQEINATAEEVSAIAQSMATGSTQQAEIITTIVEELSEANDVVDSVISQITHNLSIVKDLSEQTNVLALNTAIEAANAGEFGKGFTVIAENIRKMSDQSSRTAKIITRDSKAILHQLQTTFSIITEKIENVAAVSEESAASAEEVAASAQELTSTIQNISAKSILLNDQSIQSMLTVNQFMLTEDDLKKKEFNIKNHKDLIQDDHIYEEENITKEENKVMVYEEEDKTMKIKSDVELQDKVILDAVEVISEPEKKEKLVDEEIPDFVVEKDATDDQQKVVDGKKDEVKLENSSHPEESEKPSSATSSVSNPYDFTSKKDEEIDPNDILGQIDHLDEDEE